MTTIDEARSELARYAKVLMEFRDAVGLVVTYAEDEGDRVYFGSSNHFEALKDVTEKIDTLHWDKIMASSQPPVDLYKTIAELRASEEENRKKVEEGTALGDVAAERRRQIEAEGWTPEHDDAHANDVMAQAAICYADPNPHMVPQADLGGRFPPRPWYPAGWPWSPDWWKPTTRRRNLVKAAALLIAEIDRLDRATFIEREEKR